MKYFLTSLFLITFNLGQSFGQEYILKEDFDSNVNEWPFIGEFDKANSSIHDGVLDYENQSDRYHYTNQFVNENWNKNFEIEVKLKKISGEDYIMGFMFSGNDDKSSGYRFGIANNGFWTLQKIVDGSRTYTMDVGWTESSVIKPDDFNVLKVRKLANDFFFSINDNTVYYARNLKKVSENFALITGDSSRVHFDYAYVTETNEPEKETEELISQLVNKMGKEVTLIDEHFSNNNLKWRIGKTESNDSKIENNTLAIHNKGATQIQNTLEIPLNWFLDFSIEAKIRRTGGNNKNLYAITYGFKDWKNYSYFGFAPSGYWRFSKFLKGEEKYTSDWVKSELVKGDDYNTLTIEKIGGQIFYIVNNEQVSSKEETQNTGNYLGFLLCDSAQAQMDYLIVKQYYRTEKEQSKLLKQYGGSTSDNAKEAESLSDKKHRNKARREIEKWRGKPMSNLRKSWKSLLSSCSGSGSSGRCFFRYKVINGKQVYYQVNYYPNGGKFGPVVNDIYLTDSPF